MEERKANIRCVKNIGHKANVCKSDFAQSTLDIWLLSGQEDRAVSRTRKISEGMPVLLGEVYSLK